MAMIVSNQFTTGSLKTAKDKPARPSVSAKTASKVNAVQRSGLHFPAVYRPAVSQVSSLPSANSSGTPIQQHKGAVAVSGKGAHWPPVYSPHSPEIHRKAPNVHRPNGALARPIIGTSAVKPPVFKPERPSTLQSKPMPASHRMVRPTPTVLQRMVVTVAEASDKKGVITRAATSIVSAESDVNQVHGGAFSQHEDQGTQYQNIGQTEPLVIVAHGSAPSSWLCGCISFAPKLGGVKPEALAQQLVDKGLPNTYRGMIHLNGCETGVEGANGEPSFAERFARALASLLGAIDVEVLGNKGLAATVGSGHGAGQEVVTIKDPTSVAKVKQKGKPFLVEELADGSVKAFGAAYTMVNFNLQNFPQPPKAVTITTPLLQQSI
jgi:hypothetical protein